MRSCVSHDSRGPGLYEQSQAGCCIDSTLFNLGGSVTCCRVCNRVLPGEELCQTRHVKPTMDTDWVYPSDLLQVDDPEARKSGVQMHHLCACTGPTCLLHPESSWCRKYYDYLSQELALHRGRAEQRQVVEHKLHDEEDCRGQGRRGRAA
jgi:hypothetical protein